MTQPPQFHRLFSCIAVCVSAIVLTSCGDTQTRAARPVDDLPAIAYTEDVRIGSVDDPTAGFSRIRRVRVSENGDAYVMDGSSKDVRVFSADGQRLRVIGGPGEGPGEFLMPLDMGLLGDTLWVYDGRAQRITWFGPDGGVLFTTPTRGVGFETGLRGVVGKLVPAQPRSDGLIESELSIFVSMDREIRPYRYPVVRFDRNGEVVDTIRWETEDENAAVYTVGGRQAYAPVLGPVTPMKSSGGNGSAMIDWTVPTGSTEGLMDILRVDAEGDSVYHLNLRYEAIPVPPEVLDSLITPRLSFARMNGVPERELESALRDAVRLPEFRPPVRRVHAGDDGTVWLQLNTPSADSLADWVLVGPDGSPRGRLRLPASMQIHHSALPTVWAVELDEMDVPWLVRFSVK